VSLALVATLALALPLAAGRNDERKKQASDAQKAGRLDEAERLMCEIARSDGEDLDAKQLCEAYRGAMPMEKKRNDQRFNDGKEALAKGDFDTAKQKFSNIKWGDHLDEARNLISQIDARAGEDSAFTAGVNAWNANNVAEAEANFSRIHGAKAGDAGQYLQKIQQYKEFIRNANAALGRKEYKQAEMAFNSAAAIRSTDETRSGVERTHTLMASASSEAKPETKGGGSEPQPKPAEQGEQRGQIDARVAARLSNEGAVKEKTFNFDVNALLKDAETAIQRNQIAEAKAKISQALVKDKGNTKAQDLLDKLAANKSVVAGAEADDILISGIQHFYKARYDEAIDDLRTYVRMNGRKAALGNFYLGAARYSKYVICNRCNAELLTTAQNAFRDAHEIASFHPPEKLISPAVLKEYDKAAQ
jgi:hypothetical protein